MSSNVAPIGLARDLKERARSGRPVRIGLIGCGEMGTDIVTRVAHMEGIEVGAIVERDPERALKAARIAYGEDGHVREAGTAAALDAAMEAGALGGKVNGSGGGGTMFAYAPGRQQEVKAALDAAGGRGMIVRPRQGVTLIEESASEEVPS